MEIYVKKLADSYYGDHRITTFECRYHRYILPEVNTHRALSKNGASSRAIPTKKLIEMCLAEQVEPLEWGLDQSGMQAFTIADEILTGKGRTVWNKARLNAVRSARALNRLGFAKQIVNRVLEPFLSTRTVLTGTDWNNFLTLRDHKDAQPEFREMAAQIAEFLRTSNPIGLGLYDWHRPYMEDADDKRASETSDDEWSALLSNIGECLADNVRYSMSNWFLSNVDLVLNMVSSSRCARASYRTVEGEPTLYDDDLKLFHRLVKTQPVHASPTEHQATPAFEGTPDYMTANFTGFVPFRRLLKNETVRG